VTDVREACAELARCLPIAQALITLPDDDGTTGAARPASRFPGNPAAFNAAQDAHAGVRRVEAALRAEVTGHTLRRGGSDGNTAAALDAIAAFAVAVTSQAASEATRQLVRFAVAIQQLPAVDVAERWQRLAAKCPYCGFMMLRVAPRSGRVACLRGGLACFDSEGMAPTGTAGMGRLGPCVTWRDGLVT
jgi:hypothetical protein